MDIKNIRSYDIGNLNIGGYTWNLEIGYMINQRYTP